MQVQSAVIGQQSPQNKYFQQPRFQGSYQKTNNFYNAQPYRQQHQHPHPASAQGVEFDGKRLRKAVIRKTIDYNSAIVRQLELRVWQRDQRDFRAIQPDAAYYPDMIPPPYYVHNPINAVTTKFVRTSTNKMRCPIFCVAWTPEGRRLVTGASSGEFTLWNGLTFNFETILQAHDSPVRCMVWSHNDLWMVTGDHAGFVKYWQSNMNNVKMFQAHKEPLRGISFCPTDHKLATCSDDGTVRIWDFMRCHEERILRGHGADVKCVAWHPHKGLLVSGSKDSQQPIKLWDPKSGQSLATLHAHKSTVMEAKWNHNGNWLLTASRDHLIKLFDIRKLSQEVQTFRGHKKEVTSLAWHPVHESLFASGGSDGAVMFWLTGVDKEVGSMDQAHESIVWSLAWHPLGHILCSGSNDHTCKFWTRNRPGDAMRDKYNLNTLASGNPDETAEYDDVSMAPSIPGMGLDQHPASRDTDQEMEMEIPCIPGLDFGAEEPQLPNDNKMPLQKKVPYAKPIPRQFQQQWLDNKRPLLVAPPGSSQSNQTQQQQPQANDGPQSGLTVSVPPPSQHQMPPPPIHQGFPPRMPNAGDQQGPPRMPLGNMIWQRPPTQGPDGQVMSRFPVGNGSQFMPAGQGQGFQDGKRSQGSPQGSGFHKYPNQRPNDFPSSDVSPNKEHDKWKEYGDSDFRVDSDLRMKAKPPEGRREFSEDGPRAGNGRSDNLDQDMRGRNNQDSEFNNFQNSSTSDGNAKPPGRQRVSRWSHAPSTPQGGGIPPYGQGNMPPPSGNFGDNEQNRRRDGDWDDRMPGGRMGPMDDGNNQQGPNFQNSRKRGWDDGSCDRMDSFERMDNARNDNFMKPGFHQQPGNMPGMMPPWGPIRGGGRGDMRGGRGDMRGMPRGRGMMPFRGMGPPPGRGGNRGGMW